jgi:hypothetical protein
MIAVVHTGLRTERFACGMNRNGRCPCAKAGVAKAGVANTGVAGNGADF